MHFCEFIGWDVVRHVRIGKFKSWPKIAVCRCWIYMFLFWKGSWTECPELSPKNRGCVRGLTVPNGTFGLPVPNSRALKSQNIRLIQKPLHNDLEKLLLKFLVLFCPTFLSITNSSFFVLCDLVKADPNWLKLTQFDKNWLRLTKIHYNWLRLTEIWLTLPKEWGKIRLKLTNND